MSEYETTTDQGLETSTFEEINHTWTKKLILVGAIILLIAEAFGFLYVLLPNFLNHIPISNIPLTNNLYDLHYVFKAMYNHIVLFSFVVLGIGFHRFFTTQQEEKSKKYAIASTIVLFSIFLFEMCDYAYWFFLLPALKTVPSVLSNTIELLNFFLPSLLISVAIILNGISYKQTKLLRTKKKILYVTPIIILSTMIITFLGIIPANLAVYDSVLWVIGEAITIIGATVIYLLGLALAIEFLVKTHRLKF